MQRQPLGSLMFQSACPHFRPLPCSLFVLLLLSGLLSNRSQSEEAACDLLRRPSSLGTLGNPTISPCRDTHFPVSSNERHLPTCVHPRVLSPPFNAFSPAEHSKETKMTSPSDNLEVSCLSEFRAPLRELCMLDNDTLLFCLEGDTHVYEVRLSELKENLQKNPGKLFCRVPYLGTPLVLRGGKVGRVCVVVPTHRNEKAPDISEWVIAVDSYSQTTMKAPCKGRWKGATVFREKIILLDAEGKKTWALPKGLVVDDSSMFPCSQSASYCASCDTDLKIRSSPFDANADLSNSLPSAILVGTENKIRCCTNRGIFGTTDSSGWKSLGSYCWRGFAPGSALTAATGSAVSADILMGTETGDVYHWAGKGSLNRLFKAEVQSENEAQSDTKMISSMVLSPQGTLLFSQGTQLMATEKIQNLAGPPVGIEQPPSPVLMLRQLVCEGGDGADIAMIAGGESSRGGGEQKENIQLQADQTDRKGFQERGLNTGGGQKVYGVKFILSSRCEWFKLALNGPFKEAKQPVLPVSDTSFEALRCVVLYLHTDIVELQDSFAVDVAALARFLGLLWLQDCAKERVASCVSVANCASWLLSAERLEFPDLRKKCIEFAAKNYKEVVRTPEFKMLSSETMHEIFMAL